MIEWIEKIPPVDWVLAAAVLLAALIAQPMKRRGGRFRALPGWAGFWFLFGAVLIALSRAPRWFSYLLLAAWMFVPRKPRAGGVAQEHDPFVAMFVQRQHAHT